MTDIYPTPLNDAAVGATWATASSALGRPAPAGLQAETMSACSEPKRCHHGKRHLRECLALWRRWRHHNARAGEVAFALWFHDAIYDPQASGADSYELNSAAWAARSLVRCGADSDTAQRIHGLVMAMQHGFAQTAAAALASSSDARLLIDIDLSILGIPAERAKRYDQDGRKEYMWLPGFRYQEARVHALKSFLDRPQRNRGVHAVALIEAQARINLAAALARLAQ